MNNSITSKDHILQALEKEDHLALKKLLQDIHPQDIALIFEDLDSSQQQLLYGVLSNEISAEVLLELDEDGRKNFLKTLSSKEIAEELIEEMDSDDATDIIAELSDQQQSEIISQIENPDLARSIVDLLRYDENVAGGLMAKELIKINANSTILGSIREMRKQAEQMDEVLSIFVVNDEDVLMGILSLKKLLTTSTNTKIMDVYNPRVVSVRDTDAAEQVARDMQKYDLFEVPVVDALGRLLGRITIDDVLDFITEEADKDYQLASGISDDVDSQDSVLTLTKARLPWLIIGMAGGLVGSRVIQGNQEQLNQIPILLSFIPLIAATAGNIGVQASAIIVQGLANHTLGNNTWKTLIKEVSVSAASGFILSAIIMIFNLLVIDNGTVDKTLISLTVSLSLLIVIIFSAMIGTMIPIILHKNKIDPAIATGPFITTSNDILGVFLYFTIAKMMLGI